MRLAPPSRICDPSNAVLPRVNAELFAPLSDHWLEEQGGDFPIPSLPVSFLLPSALDIRLLREEHVTFPPPAHIPPFHEPKPSVVLRKWKGSQNGKTRFPFSSEPRPPVPNCTLLSIFTPPRDVTGPPFLFCPFVSGVLPFGVLDLVPLPMPPPFQDDALPSQSKVFSAQTADNVS